MKLCCASALVAVALAVDVPTRQIVPATSDVPAVEMPVMSIGTGIWPGEEEDAYDVVSKWLGQGGRGVDTAWLYEQGSDSERKIAQAMADQGLAREEVFITSKIIGCVGKTVAESQIKTNLQDLNTTYIDLILLHFPTGPYCAGTWALLEDYFKKGVFRAIGVSNFATADLEKLLETATVTPHVNQLMYNVFSHDDPTTEFCQSHNIVVEAAAPLTCHWNDRPDSSVFSDPTVKSIAAAHNVSAAQVAIRWLVQKDLVFTVLTSNEDHQANDADVFDFALTDDEMTTLDNLQNTATMV